MPSVIVSSMNWSNEASVGHKLEFNLENIANFEFPTLGGHEIDCGG
jgi:hypothetical protein